MKMLITALVALSATAPVLAANDAPSFRALEFRHSGQERMAIAHESFNARIPVGTPVAQAHATLEQAGARCAPAATTLTCRYAGTEAVENAHRSVHWTVDVDHAGGAVTGLRMDRESIGS